MTTSPATTKAGGALAALGNLKSAISNVKASVVIAGGDPILRLGRDGKWVYGPENIELDNGTRMAVNPLSLRHGLVCWKVIPQGSKEKPELYGKMLVSAGQPKPQPTQAHDKNGDPVDHNAHPWADVVGVDLAFIDGEEKGDRVVYEPSSTGGLRAMDDLMSAIMRAIDEHPETPVAIVELDSDHYNHSSYGKTYIPIFNIVDWVSMDTTEAPAAAEPEVKTETKQTSTAQETQAGSSAAPAASEPEQQGERRRRRRAA
jgi:hypothetical protein